MGVFVVGCTGLGGEDPVAIGVADVTPNVADQGGSQLPGGSSSGNFARGGDQPANPGGGTATPNVPSGLTPNGDGTYEDARGTRVRFNAEGQLVDDRGNVVVIGPDGIAVPLAPESEVESSFRVPVVTGRLIWTANPASGRVALVDALTHEVLTLPAGLQPTYLAAIPGNTDNRALVINAGSYDATLFRDGAGGELEQLDIPIHQNATAWTLSDSGRFAI